VPAIHLFRPLPATAAEMAQAREMMQACEASNHRNCGY
jgi:hypothetical protein